MSRVKRPPLSHRALRVYAFDPSRGNRTDNRLTIRVAYEPLGKGPTGKKVAIIDYDASNQCYYEAVDLGESNILGQSGLEPSESDPQFHQQMVYAVTMDTLRRFEAALGREVKWRPDLSPKETPYHGVLKIYPHAFQEANAYYDRQLRALLFGYFTANEFDAGSSLPGQVVFTCLSQDIIVHETTHAILDGIREHFAEPSGPDAAAFHEGFADIVALLQHFSYKETLLDTIQRTGGLIHRKQLEPNAPPSADGPMIQAEVGEDNPMVDLARQFGEAMGFRKALRGALGTRPNPKLLDTTFECHDRGGILVAAVFDAFFSVYINRTRDLVRMAYPRGEVVANFLQADLANRLADEAAKTATRIQNICIRALDYCPPVDITFGDYLRALVTSDREAMAEDELGYRAALINAFRARGIRPQEAISYSEDTLNWGAYQGTKSTDVNPDFARLWKDLLNYENDPGQDSEQKMYERLWGKVDTFAAELGLSPDHTFPIQAKSINTLQRVRPDGSLQRQIVAELVQRRNAISLDPADAGAGTFTLYGGATLLINRQGEVRYSISKPVDGAGGDRRIAHQREYLQRMKASFSLAPYLDFDPDKDLGFGAMHRGY
jgi:hypothetical protein